MLFIKDGKVHCRRVRILYEIMNIVSREKSCEVYRNKGRKIAVLEVFPVQYEENERIFRFNSHILFILTINVPVVIWRGT